MIETPDAAYIPLYAGPDVYDRYDGPFVQIRNTRFRYCSHGAIYQDLTKNEAFTRMSGVKQLGTLGASALYLGTNATREAHSWMTAIMMDIVLTQNNFDDAHRKLGIAAGLFHDVATPPYSDQGKVIDPAYYNEELLVRNVIGKNTRVLRALAKHHIDLEELVATVQGQGIVGALLNSREGLDVDNLAYIALDQAMISIPPQFREMYWLSQEDIFDEYRHVAYDGTWAFQDATTALKLVTFRAMLYEFVYRNPFNRAKEAFLARLLRKTDIKPEQFLRWNDGTFDLWFRKQFGEQAYDDFFQVLRQLFREIAREYDHSLLPELQNLNSDRLCVAVNKPPRDALGTLVQYDGMVMPLREIAAFRETASAIEQRLAHMGFIGVYERAPPGQDFGQYAGDISQLLAGFPVQRPEDWEPLFRLPHSSEH
ncbi:hypothetical protein HY491_04050 [Candidatus Woesearchaeota archaeon]|nr:hypothetical protein [Candidatus Woesearchaeota archaeon]